MGRVAKRRLAPLGVFLALAATVSSLPVLRFYHSYWGQLTRLPAAVISHERAGGGRWIAAQRVSPWLINALVATEDRTFASNFGISFEGIGRALLVDLRVHRFAQGGSTLTQQLARDTMLSPVKKFRRKIDEALLAVAITGLYSKQKILTLYLNQVYWGGGAYGIYAASERYFGIPPQRLTLPEASLIAGLPQAPSAYNPLKHFRRAKVRQWEVLQSMTADHMITEQQARSAFRAPLALIRPADH